MMRPMSAEYFEDLCSKFLQQALELMNGLKASQYAVKDDRLIAFRRAGEVLGVCPEQAAVYYMTKHWVHLLDLVNSQGERPTEEWDEVLTDLINYCLLLKGLVVSRSPLKACDTDSQAGPGLPIR
jgi:hypothetical protein